MRNLFLWVLYPARGSAPAPKNTPGKISRELRKKRDAKIPALMVSRPPFRERRCNAMMSGRKKKAVAKKLIQMTDGVGS
jgi:hypothetical protein